MRHLILSHEFLCQLDIFFLHDRPWISPWIKSIFNKLDITCHVFASQLSSHCDLIACRLWRLQQNVQRARLEDHVWRSSLIESSIDLLCRVRNKIIYALSWRTVSELTGVLFWCNKHQITLLWAHRQFAMRVHTLFYIIYWNKPLVSSHGIR